MIKVCLWKLMQPMLIIKANTGIIYYNQVGGHGCFQEEQEGYLLPVPCERFDFGYQRDIDGFTQEMADEFDQLLEDRGKLSIRIDRSRLKECREAWVHVVSIADEFTQYLFYDIPMPVQAVMTWENSD
jgi:hypothetical protein